MKDDRKKIKEPFEPDDTPKPPQQVDPGTARKRENPDEGKEQKQDPEKKPAGETGKQHLLNDEADIDDETTI